MKNKKIVLLLATALVLGACGNEAAKPADDAKKEETTVEENTFKYTIECDQVA